MSLLQRLRRLIVRPVADPATAALYGACIKQARQPDFYARLSVPDTVDGRFDLLLLHVILVMRRLGDAMTAKQRLFDLMYADMDRSLREMGVGDMGIARKMKPMLAAFYGRAAAYERALAAPSDSEDSETLTATLARNLYGSVAVAADHADRLAVYVRQVTAALEGQAVSVIAAGHVTFPLPLTASPSIP